MNNQQKNSMWFLVKITTMQTRDYSRELNGKTGAFDIAEFVDDKPDLVGPMVWLLNISDPIGQVVKLEINKDAQPIQGQAR